MNYILSVTTVIAVKGKELKCVVSLCWLVNWLIFKAKWICYFFIKNWRRIHFYLLCFL